MVGLEDLEGTFQAKWLYDAKQWLEWLRSSPHQIPPQGTRRPLQSHHCSSSAYHDRDKNKIHVWIQWYTIYKGGKDLCTQNGDWKSLPGFWRGLVVDPAGLSHPEKSHLHLFDWTPLSCWPTVLVSSSSLNKRAKGHGDFSPSQEQVNGTDNSLWLALKQYSSCFLIETNFPSWPSHFHQNKSFIHVLNLLLFLLPQFTKQTIKTNSFLIFWEGKRVYFLFFFFFLLPPQTANSMSHSEMGFFDEWTFNILPISTL